MEQPTHNLRTQMGGTAAENAPRRVGSLFIVGLVHVGIAALLILGMNAGTVEKKLEDIKASVEDQKVQPKPPPPPPPDLVKPPPVFVPPPEFQIQTDAPAPPAITTTSTRPSPPPPPKPVEAAQPPTQLNPVTKTHTTPPYPTISVRLGEEGSVLVNVTISTAGDVTEASVATSSGKPRLDQAAIEWVKAKWKWNPPTQLGKAIEARTQVRVTFSLKNAQ